MSEEEEREDLGALFARVARRVVAEEMPVLERQGLTMWEYVALSALARGAVENQLALAKAINYDKTRLVRLLDKLEDDGLVARSAHPQDRRSHVIRLTAKGAKKHAATVKGIRVMEEALLGELTVKQREVLLAVLPRLAGPR